MNKGAKVVAVLAVLGAVYSASSWYMGKQAQGAIQQLVGQANERLVKVLGPDLYESDIRISISEYKRRVFSSDVVYTLQMKDTQGRRVEYLLSDHLQHGPFPWSSVRTGDVRPLMALSHARLLPSATTQSLFDSLKGESPVTGTTRVEFLGKGSSAWRFRPLDLLENGDSLKFSGGTVDVTFSNDFQDSTAKGAFDRLEYSSLRHAKSLQMQGIVLESDTTSSVEPGTVTTRSLASTGSLVLKADGGAPVRLAGAAVRLGSTQRNKRIEGDLRYDLQDLRVGDVGLGSLKAGFKVANLNVDALAALFAEYERIRARHGVAPDHELEITGQEAVILRDRMLSVLDSQPVLAIDPFVWKNDKGQSTLRLAVNLVRPVGSSAADGVLELLPQVIERLELDIDVARSMFIHTVDQLQGAAPGQEDSVGELVFDTYAGRFARAGLLAPDEANAATRIRYENSGFEVNGRRMSTAEFMQRAFSALM